MELPGGQTWDASASTVGSALCRDLVQAELRLETDGVAAAARSSWAGDVLSVQDFGGSIPEVPICRGQTTTPFPRFSRLLGPVTLYVGSVAL